MLSCSQIACSVNAPEMSYRWQQQPWHCRANDAVSDGSDISRIVLTTHRCDAIPAAYRIRNQHRPNGEGLMEYRTHIRRDGMMTGSCGRTRPSAIGLGIRRRRWLAEEF
jgi:hypothetical protein